MASTGSLLRELRERHRVSLEELARTTRIGRRFLEALEADDFGALPSGPFAKGFIRSYCQALDEPPDEAVARYMAMTAPGVPSYEAAPSAPRQSSRGAPVLISLALLVTLGAALAGVTLALRAGRGDDDAQRPASLPARASPSKPGEAPATAPQPAPTPHAVTIQPPPPPHPVAIQPPPTPTPSTAPSVPPPASSPPSALEATVPAPLGARLPSRAATGTPYRLVARASDPTWIRVRMEGGRTIEETIPAGEVREWVSNRPFELRIGNAGGVILELNGQVLPPLGARGAIVTRLVLPSEPR